MKKVYVLLFLTLINVSVFAQSQDSVSIKKYKTFEHTPYMEMLFSFSQTEQSGKGVDDKLRFSPVFNFGHEFHLNFSQHLGVYTALGLRNIGYIDRPTYYAPGAVVGTKVKMKHRVYALVIPIGIKIGNIGKHTYLSAGSELNLFLNYKEKMWYNDSKTKRSEWFSDRVDLVHTSFFAQLNCRSSYIKFILYPDNFIRENSTTFAGDFVISDYPSSSANLFVVSLGVNFIDKPVKKRRQAAPKQVLQARL